MLDVILGEDIYNVAAVVTRYFGGVLLGTGGLVRAYSKSLQEGHAASTVIEKVYGISMEVITDYTESEKSSILPENRNFRSWIPSTRTELFYICWYRQTRSHLWRKQSQRERTGEQK